MHCLTVLDLMLSQIDSHRNIYYLNILLHRSSLTTSAFVKEILARVKKEAIVSLILTDWLGTMWHLVFAIEAITWLYLWVSGFEDR